MYLFSEIYNFFRSLFSGCSFVWFADWILQPLVCSFQSKIRNIIKISSMKNKDLTANYGLWTI